MRKRNFAIFAVLLLGALSFSNCEKTEDVVDFPVLDPTLVLNCYFSPDSIWSLRVSKSLSVIDNAELSLIGDATVKLFEEGILFSTITSSDLDGIYRFHGATPKIGKEYSVEVSHSKYETITSSDILVDAGSASISKSRIIDSSTYYDPWNGKNYGEIEGNITLKIEDQVNTDNYYLIQMYYVDTFFGVKSKALIYDLESANPAVDENYFNGLLISDFIFDGQSYEINFDFTDWNYFSGKEYYVSIESMSRAKYLYEQSFNLYLNRLHNPFAEPVMVYNNIVNGYGIFAGFSTIEKNIVF